MRFLLIIISTLVGHLAFGQQTLDLYKCKYITHPILIMPSKVYMRNKTDNSQAICLAATKCDLQAIVEDNTNYPDSYESWVACLPDRNQYCPIDVEVCKKDDRVEFADEKGKAETQEVLKAQKEKEAETTK